MNSGGASLLNLRQKIIAYARGENGCWVWMRCIDKDGYGLTAFAGKNCLAHRAAYMAFVGPIPRGMDVDHTCWNRVCCNPKHLRLLPAAENRRLQRSALKSTCIRGHLLSGPNLYLSPSKGNGRRSCRICNRLAARRYLKRTRKAP